MFCALALHHVYKQTVAARRVGFTVRIRPDYNVLVVDINGYSDHALFYKFVKVYHHMNQSQDTFLNSAL